MDHAAIAQIGAPRELYEAPVTSSSPTSSATPTSWMPSSTARNGVAGQVKVGGVELRLPPSRRGGGAGEGGRAARVAPAVGAAPPSGPALEGRVAKAAYLGTHMEYTVSTPVGELFVVDREVTRPAPAGTPVWVSFEDHGVTVVP